MLALTIWSSIKIYTNSITTPTRLVGNFSVSKPIFWKVSENKKTARN